MDFTYICEINRKPDLSYLRQQWSFPYLTVSVFVVFEDFQKRIFVELSRIRELLESRPIDGSNGVSIKPLIKQYFSLTDFKSEDRDIDDNKQADLVSKFLPFC